MPSTHRESFFNGWFSQLQYYGVVFVLVPGIFIFQISVVYPNLVQMFQIGIAKQIMHLCLIFLFFINVIGNMIFSMMIDSTLKRPVHGEGTYCEHCHMTRPAKSWHCSRCNVCILNRDHHCTFLARCIGLKNQRYYILFLAYVTIAMTYATYYNYYFVSFKFESEGWWLSCFRIINPLLRFLIPEPMGMKDMYVFYLMMNVGLILWAGSLCLYHLRNVVMGVTAYESKFPELMNSSKWKQNLLNVFGTRWYMAIWWPLSDSPLPYDVKINN